MIQYEKHNFIIEACNFDIVIYHIYYIRRVKRTVANETP